MCCSIWIVAITFVLNLFACFFFWGFLIGCGSREIRVIYDLFGCWETVGKDRNYWVVNFRALIIWLQICFFFWHSVVINTIFSFVYTSVTRYRAKSYVFCLFPGKILGENKAYWFRWCLCCRMVWRKFWAIGDIETWVAVRLINRQKRRSRRLLQLLQLRRFTWVIPKFVNEFVTDKFVRGGGGWVVWWSYLLRFIIFT